ncbi:MAG: hypothetical protein EOO48_00480 [Flavobacterium sp.]|nr:MAG: hypothetical protein EOO48_00480 [Flavobacterium sp.]
MKKIILLVLGAFSIISCDLGSGEANAEFVLAPVQDVTMPATYKVDSVSVITVRYKRPDDCHIFNGYYYNPEGMTRTCAIEFAHLTNQSNCVADEEVYEVPLNFRPVTAGIYTFRFWDGTNPDGSQHFFEAEADVNY